MTGEKAEREAKKIETGVIPNPVRKGQSATLHLGIPRADKISIRIYDASGDLAKKWEIQADTKILKGRPVSLTPINTSGLTSGTYNGVIIAEKQGETTQRGKFRFSIIK